MSKQTLTGLTLVIGALALWAYNAADLISDLSDWHGLSRPDMVGPLIKQGASVVLGVVGGANLPQIGKRDA